MKPKSYKVQDGCKYCKFAFTQTEHEESPNYFCHIDGSKRPKCGSILMGESFLNGKPSFDIQWNIWITWSDPREVDECGTCKEFINKRT